jgi:hypothetical protein
VRVVVAPMVLTTTWWLGSGRPRQVVLIREYSRCSIVFNLEVPGGKWPTVTSRPAAWAKLASSVFQARTR